MTAKKKISPVREALRQAHLRLKAAQSAVDEAENAVAEAQRRQYQAARRAEELLEEEEKPDDVVTMISAGDVDALVRPTAEIEAAENEARAWKKAKETAAYLAESRLAELERARANVDEAARAVVDEMVDIEKLIAEARAARSTVVKHQNELISILALLPDFSVKSRSINEILSESWLLSRPVQESRWSDMFVALKTDHEASL